MANWNKGLTKYTDERVAKYANSLTGKKKTAIHCINISKGLKGKTGHPSWNKGLTLRDDLRLARTKETREKQSLSHLGRKHPNRKRPSDIFCSNSSLRMKEFWAVPSQKAIRAKHIIEGSHQRPTKFELKLGGLINEVCPNEYRYVGDGSVILNGLCPDFVNIDGQKKIIEAFGDYWHSSEKSQSWNRTELGRLVSYNSLGCDCLIIWESELKSNTANVLEKIREFNKKC